MAKTVAVLLTFIPGRLEKMRELGREHHIISSTGILKNATICMSMINLLVDLRNDETVSKIITREGIPLMPLVKKAVSQYAASKGLKMS